MKASELLEVARDDYLDDKEGEQDKRLWSDKALLRRLNQAQREAASRALLLRDSATPRICALAVVANQVRYAMDPRIIKVHSLRLEWPDGRLTALPALSSGEAARVFGPDWRTEPGEPKAYVPDGHAIQLCPAPAPEYAGFALRLDVCRYPLALLLAGFSSALALTASEGETTLTLRPGEGSKLPALGEGQELHLTGVGGTVVVTGRAGDVLTCLPLAADWPSGAAIHADNEPEIPAHMHEALLYYVAGHAYLKRDVDVEGSKANAPGLLALFTQAFGPPVDHSQRMHQLAHSGRMQFGGITYPSFGRLPGRTGYAV